MVRMVRMVRSLADRTFQLCRRPEGQRGLDVVLDVGDAVHVGDGQVLREELADVLTGNAGRTAGSFARRSIG